MDWMTARAGEKHAWQREEWIQSDPCVGDETIQYGYWPVIRDLDTYFNEAARPYLAALNAEES